jgi:hypothetical protein
LIFSCKSEPKEISSTINSPLTNQPISLSKKITTRMLKDHSFQLNELRILRNEIFARKGYIFKSEDLNAYFSDFEWYNPRFTSDEIDTYLSEIDKKNIEVIANYEKILKENIWLTKTYDTFTFEDLINCIPEFSLPLDFDDVQYKNQKSVNLFFKMDYKFIDKFRFKEGSPYGKIPINDTIYAIGLSAASDLYTFYTVVIVDHHGNRLDYFKIPISQTNSDDYEDLLEKDTIIRDVYSQFTNTVITSDFNQIATGWGITTIRDSLGNVINQIYSDTVIGESEIYEITQFLD